MEEKEEKRGVKEWNQEEEKGAEEERGWEEKDERAKWVQ